MSGKTDIRPLTPRLVYIFIHNLHSGYLLEGVLVTCNTICLKININKIEIGGCHLRYYVQGIFPPITQ